jgi:hypothetical protein
MSAFRSRPLCSGTEDLSHLSRRELLLRAGGGLAGMAFLQLLADDGLLADSPAEKSPGPQTGYNLLPKPPHFPGKAKNVICLFQQGGPSQMDLFDPKPALEKYDGQKYPGDIEIFGTDKTGIVLRSPFKFAKHGQSGAELSELLPHLAEVVDDLAIVRSCHTEHNNHIPAQLMFNTGRIFGGRPSIGSWLCYGLGTENQSLPAYVALPDPASFPVDDARNWTCGWLPPLYQGTMMQAGANPVVDLNLPARISREQQRRNLDLLAKLNTEHLKKHPAEGELAARISNYELAARMQTAALEALDLNQETPAMRKLYGLDSPPTAAYGSRCLMARRLVEHGVRFVHIFLQRQSWDHHNGLKAGLTSSTVATDLPVAGLLRDLKSRGLLDSTLVIWAGEFGRLPVAQRSDGRDHNRNAFTIWMAGGGIKPGVTYGATDDFGYAAAVDKVSMPDLHATILHLLGLDHKRLTYRHGNRDETLTDVNPARIVKEILA